MITNSKVVRLPGCASPLRSFCPSAQGTRHICSSAELLFLVCEQRRPRRCNQQKQRVCYSFNINGFQSPQTWVNSCFILGIIGGISKGKIFQHPRLQTWCFWWEKMSLTCDYCIVQVWSCCNSGLNQSCQQNQCLFDQNSSLSRMAEGIKTPVLLFKREQAFINQVGRP